MAERGKFNPRGLEVPRTLSAGEVKDLVEQVKRAQREVAEQRRLNGERNPEAPGLTPEARGSLYIK